MRGVVQIKLFIKVYQSQYPEFLPGSFPPPKQLFLNVEVFEFAREVKIPVLLQSSTTTCSPFHIPLQSIHSLRSQDPTGQISEVPCSLKGAILRGSSISFPWLKFLGYFILLPL